MQTALLGGFISIFGLVSYLVKENFYLSEARGSPPRRGPPDPYVAMGN